MRKQTLLFVVSTLVAASSLTALCYGQPVPPSVADRATREVDRSFREEADQMLAPKPPEPAKKKEITEEIVPEGPKFFVKEIRLKGVESVDPAIFRQFIEKYENKEVSLGELEILSKQIEREYLRNGVIAACFIPPQDTKEGIVIMQVVEARMGELTIQSGRFFSDERVKYYWGIDPGEVLRYDKMSRSLQFMNKNPDREVKATLYAGKKPGTTDVLLTQETYFPFHVFFTYDKEGTTPTGKDRFGYGIRDNNTLGLDDTLLMGYTYGKDFYGLYAYHRVPITNYGTSIMYGYSDSKSQPKKQYDQFGITSRSQNTSVYLHQDLYEKAKYVGEIAFGMDANDKVTSSFAGTILRNRFRVLRVKGTYLYRAPGSITYFLPRFSQGLHIFGARGINAPLSLYDDKFTKFNIGLRHTVLLPLDAQLRLSFDSQIAAQSLASQEQFALGGIDSVRGYPPQDFMADNAYQANFELHFPPYFIPEDWKIPYDSNTIRNGLTGLVFLDYAYGEKRGALGTTERRNVNYSSVGVGMDIRTFDQVYIRLAWGFPMGTRSLTEGCSPRFHFSLNFEDQFDREIQRIRKEMKQDEIKNLAWKLLDDELRRPGSRLAEKMYGYLDRAQEAETRGDYQEARSYYRKIQTIGDSIFSQAENYVKEITAQKEALKELADTARVQYDKGEIEKSKETWERVLRDAEIKPLVLEM